MGYPFEHWKLAEWAVKSIQAYKDMHFPNDNTDYSYGMSFDNVIDYLFERGISADYNKPMTREQIKRMGEIKCRTVYNNIKATHNLVSVCNVKAKDLHITHTDRFTYLLTYSFPCQDLSSAGLSKGMAKGSGTRSGLLWEIERILKECDELPQVLLMENVPEVIGQKNKDSFGDWIAFLDSMGYKSKWEILNGTDFEIPQNRKRCFMVSVLGDYYYDFPQKLGCTLRLKDLLEKNVSEEYYLSDNILNYFIKHTKESEEKGNGFRFEPTNWDCIAKCVTTRAGGRMDDNFIDDKVHSVVKLPHGYFPGSIERNAEASPTIDTGVGNWHTLIGEETISHCEQLGYIEKDGFNEMTGRVYGTNGASPTVRTFCGGGQEDNSIKMFQYPRGANKGGIRDVEACPTITTCSWENNCMLVEPLALNDTDHLRVFDAYHGREIDNSKCGTICTNSGYRQAGVFWVQNSDMRVRKLTPRECFRLMGVKDEDYERVAHNQSKSSLYHCAGDSIVVNVLMAIFKELFM
ncbi:MAG: DNA (cytosine-5-)-methyltransferase [Bacteroidaceae bacterium]|nr:DNA (cytosine-5-)-methyltransferase [Bacteroidaceae bacterium]